MLLKFIRGTVESIQNMQPPPVPRLLSAAQASGFVRGFDQTSVYWERHGPDFTPEGPLPMVFCYGLVCSTNQWRAQIERYSKYRPCIVLDYRGHHKSSQPKSYQKMSVAACAKDVAAVVNHLVPQGPVHVWGHSMGCNVSLEYALAEPERVRSLTLLCGTAGNPFEDMFKNRTLENFLVEFIKSYPRSPDIYRILWQTVRHLPQVTNQISRLVGFNSQTVTEKDTETYALSVANIYPETFFPLAHELSTGQTTHILAKIKTPTLVIAGALDKVTPPSHQKSMSDGLPNSTYIEIPAGSHNVQIDFGEYVCMKVEEFWGKLKLD